MVFKIGLFKELKKRERFKLFKVGSKFDQSNYNDVIINLVIN